ncbi:MAG: CBS domain-containing protein [Thermodesulfobacteriota bacterium]
MGEFIDACSQENTIKPDEDAVNAFSIMRRSGRSRLLVVEAGRLVGILSLKDLLGFLSMKVELEK